MKASCLSGILFGLLANTAMSTPIQWTEASGGNDHWYEFVDAPGIPWDQARDAAAAMVLEVSPGESRNGYLATVTYAEENAWLKANVYPSVPQGWDGAVLWLGGYQDGSAPDYWEPGGGWRWVAHDSGIHETWSFSDWLPAQPDDYLVEDYLEVLLHENGRWNDIRITANPSWNLGYIAEWTPEPGSLGLIIIGGLLLAQHGRRVCRVSLQPSSQVGRVPPADSPAAG